MRAGRPRSRVGRPHGEVEGIRRATSLKAGLSPLGNSRLPASRAPAPRDGADHTRGKQGTDSWAPVGLSRGRRPDRSPWERGRPARIPSQLSGAASASRKGSNGAVAG